MEARHIDDNNAHVKEREGKKQKREAKIKKQRNEQINVMEASHSDDNNGHYFRNMMTGIAGDDIAADDIDWCVYLCGAFIY